MDSQGVSERLEEAGRHEAEQRRAQSAEERRQVEQYGGRLCTWEYDAQNPTEAGRECIDKITAMQDSYESFWRLLVHGKTASSARVNLGQSLVLERGKEIDGLGKGILLATVAPGAYDPAADEATGNFGVSVAFVVGGETAYSEREGKIGSDALCRDIHHNEFERHHFPFDHWTSVWSVDKVERARAYLEGELPRAQATLDWLLEAACDPNLNPAIVERAQAYRDDLLAAA